MTLNLDESLRDKIVDCLSQQLSEFELLKSMYPNNGEIVLTDNNVLDDIQNYLECKSEYTPNNLDFTINLIQNGLKLEVCINLPGFYPSEEPDIFVRCNQLNRQQETALNTELSDHLKSNYYGEVCIYTAISWLQENIYIFISNQTKASKPLPQNKDETEPLDEKFVRLWIYSHHIYNKRKREEIVKLAKELHLTGFCLPGKPGIVCIEGTSADCKEWWKDIKSMCWKKIIIRKTEVFELSEQKQQQKFDKFEEISFQNPSSRHSKHADMSSFSKFMEERGLNQSFNDFFGLCCDD
ncbi:RWD domain-containing protein 2B [Pectinophora gossypiella]|uniref:RWD domain-containing protein 2B n=1 Tax=Pectinophora gossypiella TaxID=13191 RepID=UPI00214F26F9|nr:RWD domain-containing protein 2B [Pectinophora gossypiella]XP_049865667.1 RWD domain-containing protein 2B [Pectinophora gossypiella]XP_049865668.1 RWD domain-containing protein 2B [Pectinophora gossypiella]